MTNKGFYTQEEKERRFNFIPFVSCLTHRIEVYYKSGASCSSPAKFITDQEAIETAITYLNELVERKSEIKKIVVLKYDNKGGLNTIYEKEPLKIVNVLEDSFPLWEYCNENGLTDLTYDDWSENGGELQFFEGDPDIIKVHGDTGYFCRCGNTVFYYFDDCMTHDAWYILKAFYMAFETGVTLGGYHKISGKLPAGVSDNKCIQNWDAWEKIQTGIAWRGGAGYTYYIQAWGQYLARA